MVKKLLSGLFLVCVSVTLAACDTDTKKSATPILVVSQESVFTKSDSAKSAVAYLEGIGKDLQTELMNLQAQAQKSGDTGKAELEKGFDDLQQRFAGEQQNVTNKVNELFNATVEKIRVAKGASIVLASDIALVSEKSIDITDEVVAEMNKTPLTFTALSVNATAPADAMPAKNATKANSAQNGTKQSNATAQ